LEKASPIGAWPYPPFEEASVKKILSVGALKILPKRENRFKITLANY
jgi:hypothetical protein